MQVKYFKDADGEIHGLINEVQDHLIKEDFVPLLVQLLESIDLNITLGQQGITNADVPWMAENCMKVSAPSMLNSPRVFDQKEIEELYYRAM